MYTNKSQQILKLIFEMKILLRALLALILYCLYRYTISKFNLYT